MNKTELLRKIRSKKEFSKIPLGDVKLILDNFNCDDYSDSEKIKLTRALLQKNYTSFLSRQLFSSKAQKQNEEWILNKHISSRERLDFYDELYKRIFIEYKNKKISIVDFGAGVNGFSYNILERYLKKPFYLGIEAIGQFTDLMNNYFQKNKINAKAVHASLFNLERMRKLALDTKNPRVAFFFKVANPLESLKRNYTKDFLLEIVPLFDKFVLSFATKSVFKKENFKATGKWLVNFIEDSFRVLDKFEFGNEKYLVIQPK